MKISAIGKESGGYREAGLPAESSGMFRGARSPEEKSGADRSLPGLRGKLCRRGGMSLTETLVAVLLLSLFTMTAASGIGAAVRLYTKSVTFSEAQTLASTLTQALTDELRYARNIDASEGTEDGSDTVVFDSLNYGGTVSVQLSDGKVVVRADGSESGGELIPDNAYTSGLKATQADVTYKNGLFTVQLQVSNRSDELLASSKVTVRALNAQASNS